MSDLVSRLSETIDELERVAQAATDGPWEFDGAGVDVVPTSRSGSYIARFAQTLNEDDAESITQENGAHIARWDPKAVLGLVVAVREIIKAYEGALIQQRRRPNNAENNGYVLGISRAVHELLVGFGITEED